MNTLLVIIGLIFTLTTTVYAETESSIPDWIQDNAEWWSQGKISDQEFISAIQYLIDNNILQVKQDSSETEKLKTQNQEIQKNLDDLTEKYNSLQEQYQEELAISKALLGSYYELSDESKNYENEVNKWIDQEQSKPTTTIHDQIIYWHMTDSEGNMYDWTFPVSDYEKYVTGDRYNDELYFQSGNGESFSVLDHTRYVRTSFSDVIDDVYKNSIDDQDFMYEVWYITSQLTTYSYDIGEYPRWAVETLSRGGGDCEDTTILILDMLKSSQYTKDWKFEMLYFDSDNIENPDTINHVVPVITINGDTWIIESTAKTEEEMNKWNEMSVDGWAVEV